MNYTKFEFRGDGLTYLFYLLGSYLLVIVTLYIGAPWAYCWRIKWYFNNIYINNRRLNFRGTGIQVFGLFLWILFASIITLGLYIPFGIVRLTKWKWENTFFEDEILNEGKIRQHDNISSVKQIEKIPGAVFLQGETDEGNLNEDVTIESLNRNIDSVAAEEMDLTCISCNSIITLEGDELKEETYTCPVCNNVNRIRI